MRWVGVALLFHAASAARDFVDDMFCHQLDAQKDLSLEKMLGKWYIVEIVHHRQDSALPKGESIVDTCPIVHLSMQDNQNPSQAVNLKMQWWEDAGDVTYDFYIYYNQPGNWISAGAQNGSLIKERQYKQFAGLVFVTKAVSSHAILTFCSAGADLYSVLMSRTNKISRQVRESCNSLLDRKGFPREAVRRTCRGGASNLGPSLLTAIALIASMSRLR